MDDVKAKVKKAFCYDFTGDDNLLFNCIHYSMSENCFYKTYGNKGAELG